MLKMALRIVVTFAFILHLSMGGRDCATALVWNPEDNLKELSLPFYQAVSGD